MRIFVSLFAAWLFFLSPVFAADDAADLEAQGVEALKLSQTTPDAIVQAALFFGKAAVAYEAEKNEEKETDMNGYLYWCKKKMTSAQIDEFLKGKDPTAQVVAKRLTAAEKKALPAADAQKYFDRADGYAKAHPAEHLLIAIRFFEIADRFKGTAVSLNAQDRSLQEMMLTTKADSATAAAAAPDAQPAAIPAGAKAADEPAKKSPVPTAAKLAEVDKSLRDIFKDEFAKTAPADKLAFAQRLTKESDATQDPAERYAMLLQAATLASQTGDLLFFMDMHDRLAAGYEPAPKTQKLFGLGVIIGATRDAALSRAAISLKVLADKPDDPTANQTVGKYFLIAKKDPVRALPMLAKATTPDLQHAAKLDLAAPQDPVAETEVADAWWTVSEKTADKEEKHQYEDRAAYWYRLVLPSVTGLNKMKIERRVAMVEPSKTTTAAATVPATTPTSAMHASPSTFESGTIANEELSLNKTIGPGVFKLAGSVKAMEKTKTEITFVPGTFVSNGTFEAQSSCSIRAEGTDEKPLVFRNVTFAQDLGGYFYGKNVVFDNCTFKKTGAWFAYFSTRWRMYGCTFYKCTFVQFTGVDYGFNFQGCTFIGMKFPEIKHKSDEDYQKNLRGDWNQIGACCFWDCQIPPTVFICSEQCSFLNSRFMPGLVVPLDKEWQVEALIVNCSGKIQPDSTGPAVKVTQVNKPYPGPFPAPCSIMPELAPAYKQIADMHRGYKWISRDATYTLSSQESVEPSPKFLNGERGARFDADRSCAMHTRNEDGASAIIDLGSSQSIAAMDIENRSQHLSRAKSLTASIGDAPTGPWTEVWKNDDAKRSHWEIVLDKPQMGRYVKLALPERNTLNLNEARIFEKH